MNISLDLTEDHHRLINWLDKIIQRCTAHKPMTMNQIKIYAT